MKWTEANAAEARIFFQSETGLMALRRLEDEAPDVDGLTVEAAALQGTRASGYRDCLRALHALYRPVEKPSVRRPFVTASE